MLNEGLELTRRQLPKAHRWLLVGDELQELGDGGEVVGGGPCSEPAECRQVLLIARELVRALRHGLDDQETMLLKVRPEGPRSGGQIRSILRMARRTDLKIHAANRREGAAAATQPPLLQSTRRA
jgi:hypothetical protein